MNARIAVFVELTVLYDVVVGVLCAVDNVLLGATGGFVAFYEQSVVACVGDIHMIEVPVRRGQTYALIGIVAVSVGRMVAVDDGATIKTHERIVVVCRSVAVVDVDTLGRTIFTGSKIDGCSWFCCLVYCQLYACKRGFGSGTVVVVVTVGGYIYHRTMPQCGCGNRLISGHIVKSACLVVGVVRVARSRSTTTSGSGRVANAHFVDVHTAFYANGDVAVSGDGSCSCLVIFTC